RGLIAINIREDDELISVAHTDGDEDIIVGTRKGMIIRFNENDVRSMGRTASGVKAITLKSDDYVVSMQKIGVEVKEILTVTQFGFGKRTPIEEYRLQTRGGKGILTYRASDKNGDVRAIRCVNGDEDLMVITESGILIRTDVSQISVTGRTTMGVKLIRLGDEQLVSTVAVVPKEEETDEEFEEDVE
ncbi:MAG: DNA gyrase C-terminal beta-propeller domain-containing protein, partial [Bacilli bacterium]